MALVDDLGYSSVGFNSPAGEPKTPVIDALSKSGALLSHHYVFRFCSPSRSSFLSGRLPIHVNQQNHPPNVPGGGVPIGMTTISEVLKRQGYATVHAGKWHGGMSHPNLLPINRGFDTSLAMLAGASDHYTNVRDGFVDMWLDDAPAWGYNGTYNLFTYLRHALDAIERHNATAQPLFLYMAFQDVHAPTEAPERFFTPYPTTIHPARRKGLAQISAVDEAIGNLTSLLHLKKMWDESLFIFSADNGGPADHEPNYPLRGSKGSDWEGGVRAVAFITGGFLPLKMRGGTIDGQMHICDWYATFARLAGVAEPLADHAAEALGLPPLDSIDMWPVLSGNASSSPRVEIPLSASPRLKGTALIVSCPSEHCPGSHGRFKLVRGTQNSFFPGPTTPNGTAHGGQITCETKGACLFDLTTDPIEHVDLAQHKPELLHRLKQRAAALDATVYQSPGGMKGDPKSKEVARLNGGFWGPWQSDDDVVAAAAASADPWEGWREEDCDDCV